MRALPPIPGFFVFFPVTHSVLDLTNALMIYHMKFPKQKFLPAHRFATLGNKIQIRGPPIQTGLEYHQYIKVMENATNNDNVEQRKTEEKCK